MTLHSLLADSDPHRLAWLVRDAVEAYGWTLDHWQPMAVGAAVAAIICGTIMFTKRPTVVAVQDGPTIGQWVVSKWPVTVILQRMKERDMRTDDERERQKIRSDALRDANVDFIEHQRDTKAWSDLECDVEYTRLSKRWPIFKHAVDHHAGVREYFRELSQTHSPHKVVVIAMGGVRTGVVLKNRR